MPLETILIKEQFVFSAQIIPVGKMTKHFSIFEVSVVRCMCFLIHKTLTIGQQLHLHSVPSHFVVIFSDCQVVKLRKITWQTCCLRHIYSQCLLPPWWMAVFYSKEVTDGHRDVWDVRKGMQILLKVSLFWKKSLSDLQVVFRRLTRSRTAALSGVWWMSVWHQIID